MGPNNTKNLALECYFLIFNYEPVLAAATATMLEKLVKSAICSLAQ